jgi:hypothetical protein
MTHIEDRWTRLEEKNMRDEEERKSKERKEKIKDYRGMLDQYRKSHPAVASTLLERERAAELILKFKEAGIVSKESIEKNYDKKKSEILLNIERLSDRRENIKERIKSTNCNDFFNTNFSLFSVSDFERVFEDYLRKSEKATSYAQEELIEELFNEIVNDKHLISNDNPFKSELELIEETKKDKLQSIEDVNKEIETSPFKDFIMSQLN